MSINHRNIEQTITTTDLIYDQSLNLNELIFQQTTLVPNVSQEHQAVPPPILNIILTQQIYPFRIQMITLLNNKQLPLIPFTSN
jgi:hypothetical protein